MKVLNLYSGIGGNRKLWNEAEITAVESDPKIAEIYSDFFPEDRMIVGDAHEFLIQHFGEFDFIWASPPCPTHSQYRYRVGVLAKDFDPIYPDMTLYQEIILLKYHFGGKWVVENTESYYDPLIPPQKIQRHYFWANYFIPDMKITPTGIRSKNRIGDMEEAIGFDLSKYKIPGKRKILRNCVRPELGLHIFESRNFNRQIQLLERKEEK